MIIEFCGLPGSGKSTFSKLLQIYLSDAGVPADIKKGPTFHNNMKSQKNIIKGLLLCFTNICRAPILAHFILQNIITSKHLNTKSKCLKIYISLQYHINWFQFRKSLNYYSESSHVTIIDGSPYNIVNDTPNCDTTKLLKYLKTCYSRSNNNIIIFSHLDEKKCLSLITSRPNQPLEPILYGDLKLINLISHKLNIIHSLLSKNNHDNQSTAKYDLFLKVSLDECRDTVFERWRNDVKN